MSSSAVVAGGLLRPRLHIPARLPAPFVHTSCRRRTLLPGTFRSAARGRCVALVTNGSTAPSNGVHLVRDFMTCKRDLHVVKPTTTIDTALEMLVENRITGFPVIDDDWRLDQEMTMDSLIQVGVVSDYDMLALDSISGSGQTDNSSLFPEANSSWKAFNEIQNLLGKTNGKVIADVMTPAPLVIRENSNLEYAARLLLETKYRRLPVVDASGKLVGIVTRKNVVKAALQLKRESEKNKET